MTACLRPLDTDKRACPCTARAIPKYFPQSGLKLARGGPAGWREGLAAEQQELCTPQAAAAAAAEQAVLLNLRQYEEYSHDNTHQS